MDIFQLLCRVAAARGGSLSYGLDLGAGLPALPCRDPRAGTAYSESLERIYG